MGMAYFKEKNGEADAVAVRYLGSKFKMDFSGHKKGLSYGTRISFTEMNVTPYTYSGYEPEGMNNIRACSGLTGMSVQQNLYRLPRQCIFIQGREQCQFFIMHPDMFAFAGSSGIFFLQE